MASINFDRSSRILGVGVLNYETTRKALDALCESSNHSLVASVEYNYQPSHWKRPVEIFDFYECLHAKYDLANCSAIGTDLLNALIYCEATYLKMIGRLDYRDEMSYEDRKYHYLRQVMFWNTAIDRLNITHAVFFNFPHEMYDYVIYNLCKIKGIQTLIFDDFSVVPDTLFIIRSIEESCPKIGLWYDKLKEANQPPQLTKLKAYYQDFKVDKKNQTHPTVVALLQVKKEKERFIGKLKYMAARLPDIFKKPALLFDRDFGARWKPAMQLQERRLLKVYDRLSLVTPNLNCKYIYLALHYQPENSSCPMGGGFVEQWLIAEMIAKNMPSDFVLYVKEHPLQKKHGRKANLYEHIASLPNTFLVSRNVSSFALIDGCQAVATITGTAGWEGFLTGKPVLKFGHSFYQFAPGVFKIKNEKDVQEAMTQIVKGVLITETDQKRYLEAMERASIDGWVLDFIKKQTTSLETDDIVSNIYTALREEIEMDLVGRA
jgi:hypothetical protein